MAGMRFEVFTVVEPKKEGGKSFWVRVGTGFENRDGSISVYLDALPVNGKLQIREPRERKQGSEGGGESSEPSFP